MDDIKNIVESIKFNLKNIAFLRFSRFGEYPNVISPFTRIYFVKEGYGNIVIGRNKILLEPNHLYIIPGFTSCSYQFEKDMSHIYIHVSIDIQEGLKINNLFTIKNKIIARPIDEILFNRCLELNPGYQIPHLDPKVYQKKPWADKQVEFNAVDTCMETSGILRLLVSRFVGNDLQKNAHSSLSHNIQDALVYIQKNISEVISIKELANRACISKDHFTRCFKLVIGMPPSEFIMQKRIEKAQTLLITTDHSLTNIAEKSGFKNTAYFSRVFKTQVSITPMKFRQMNRFSG